MAEQKIKAGGVIETLTRAELKDALGEHLRSWAEQTAVGGRFTKFLAQGAVTAAGALSIGGSAGSLGPPAGFVWDVRRLHITGLVATDVAALYINEAAPSQLVATTTDLPLAANRSFLWDRQVVLSPGDELLVVGVGALTTTANTQITVSGQVLELPVGLVWKLS